MTTFRDALNPLLLTDAYKLDHRRQYPEGTTRVYSNYTNRGSRLDGIDHVVHFGLQAFIKDVCEDAFNRFFAADVDEVCAEYERAVTRILGPNDVGSDHIRQLHGLGYLPIEFCGMPEGELVPLRVPSFTITNTHDDFAWLVNYLETAVSSAVWQASTSATQSHYLRQQLSRVAAQQGSDVAAVAWQAHDFSFRGMPGIEAACASSAGHLLSFKGTDCLPVFDWVDYFYEDFGDDGEPLGGSVPATEHSVMCAGGMDDEAATFERILDLYPSGVVSVVSDTWNLWDVVAPGGIVDGLKERILARDGKLVIRPDSGDPVDIICGTVDYALRGLGSPEELGVVELLWEVFGGTTNAKGFKVLDPHIGVIYGDSITRERAADITERLAAKGFAASNVVFGIGSYTFQYVTRDTFGSAMKATWAKVNGEGRNLLKNPITDSGLKKSATGRLAVLTHATGEKYLVEDAAWWQEEASRLQPIWVDGFWERYQSFNDVRDTLRESAAVLRRIDAKKAGLP